MVAVGDVLGKFSSLKAAESELSRLGFIKTKGEYAKHIAAKSLKSQVEAV